jgi:hypothetical protein
MDEKIAALQAHASQITQTNIKDLSSVDITRSSTHFRGIQGRVRNAEAFVPLRLLKNVGS